MENLQRRRHDDLPTGACDAMMPRLHQNNDSFEYADRGNYFNRENDVIIPPRFFNRDALALPMSNTTREWIFVPTRRSNVLPALLVK